MMQIVYEVEYEGEQEVHRIHESSHDVEPTIAVWVIIILWFLRKLKRFGAEN